MTIISRTFTFTDGTTAYGSEVETEVGALYTLFNNLDAASSVWTNVKGATFEATTLLKGKGTITADNATTGYIGEAARSSQTTEQSIAVSGEFINVTTISLSAGDWDVTGIVLIDNAGGAATVTACQAAVSAFSANTTTDHVIADNWITGPMSSTSGINHTLTVANWRVNISATATYYLKATATFSAGNPRARGRISARRVR